MLIRRGDVYNHCGRIELVKTWKAIFWCSALNMLPFGKPAENLQVLSGSSSSDDASDDEPSPRPPASKHFQHVYKPCKPPNPRPSCLSIAASDSDNKDANERTTIPEPFYCLGSPARRNKKYNREYFENFAALKHDYKRIKKMHIPEKLSEFMPSIPDVIDDPNLLPEGSTLSSLQKFCPMGNLNMKPLSALDLEGFRLHPGPLPAQFRTGNDKLAALENWPPPIPSPVSSDPASCASEEDEMPVEIQPTKISQKSIKASMKALQKPTKVQKKAANKSWDKENKDERKKATKKRK